MPSVHAATEPVPLGRRHRLLFGIAVAGLLAYVLVAVLVAVRQAPALRPDPQDVALALLLSFASFGLRFQRWTVLLGVLGHRLPAGRHFLAYLSGFALTTTPGKAGEALRGYFLQREGVPFADSVAAFLAERLMDVLALCLLALLLTALAPSLLPAALALAALSLAGALVVTGPRFAGALGDHGLRRGGRLGRLATRVAAVLGHSGRMLAPSRLIAGTVTGLLAWGGQGLGLYLLGVGAGVEWTPGLAIGIYAAGLLASLLVFFLPGGIGGTELALVGLLSLAGVGTALALPLVLLSQLANLWFAVLLGLAAVALLGLRAPANGSATP